MMFTASVLEKRMKRQEKQDITHNALIVGKMEFKRLPKTFVEEKIKEWSAEGILGAMSEDMSGNNNEQKIQKKLNHGKRRKYSFAQRMSKDM